MIPRPVMLFIFAILASTLASAGCGGGTSERKPTPTATSPAAATATLEPTGLSLNEYLIITLRLEADLNRVSAGQLAALPNLQEDPQAFLEANRALQQNLAQLYGEAVDALSEVTPPPEAQAYHTGLLDVFRDLVDMLDRLAAAEGTEEIATLSLELSLRLSDFAEVGGQGQRLAITALEAESDDPLNAYLISATQTRLEFTTEFTDFGSQLQESLSSVETEEDLSALFALFDEFIADLEDFEDRWQQLSAPPEAQEPQQRQAELIAEVLDLERSLLNALRDQDERALIAAVGSFQELGVQSGTLVTDWNELLIEALSR